LGLLNVLVFLGVCVIGGDGKARVNLLLGVPCVAFGYCGFVKGLGKMFFWALLFGFMCLVDYFLNKFFGFPIGALYIAMKIAGI
jgi:hypothetical protein